MSGRSPALHRLMHLVVRRFGRAVLGLWLLATLTAIASPLVHPQAIELVCSQAGTVRAMVQGEDGALQEMGGAHLDCAQCLPGGAPPPLAQSVVLPMPQPLARAMQPIEAARLAAATAAPLPARGPPRL